MANLYLREDLGATSVGDIVALSGAEAKHAVAVSRTRVGDRLLIGNGSGMLVAGVVTAIGAGSLDLCVDEVRTGRTAAPRIALAQALAKGDRDELAVQTSTELGVDEIVPWAASRSIVRWSGDKMVKGEDRWRSIAREATKQSMRWWLPRVGALVTTRHLARRAEQERVLVLEPTASTALSQLEFDERDLVLVVGPEGGIAPDELDDLEAGGAELVRLGDAVLRTSSAGPAAIAVINAATGRW